MKAMSELYNPADGDSVSDFTTVGPGLVHHHSPCHLFHELVRRNQIVHSTISSKNNDALGRGAKGCWNDWIPRQNGTRARWDSTLKNANRLNCCTDDSGFDWRGLHCNGFLLISAINVFICVFVMQKMGLWTILEGFLLLANAMAILNEDRFLAPRGWSFSEFSTGQTKSFKGQLIGLIYATQYMRLPLILLNAICIVVMLISG
ncbi:hypothetical protein Gotri_000327 [Gossypium trilobum]|uniref:Immediate early response 3-interacting protein 1-like n=1 Tax=Gossypium trilobum TaxID=34281 RepID=A0A7J9FBU3_9ROSI|nr:hypothetical protein [Gossypium trilobum]